MKQLLSVIAAGLLLCGLSRAGGITPPDKQASTNNATAAQELLYKQKIVELLTLEEWQWVDFGDKDAATVQVARPSEEDATHFKVTVVGTAPFKDSPEIALGKMGIAIPNGWKMTEWPLETTGEFSVPKADQDKLPAFIHAVFLKYFKSPPDYKATAAFGKP